MSAPRADAGGVGVADDDAAWAAAARESLADVDAGLARRFDAQGTRDLDIDGLLSRRGTAADDVVRRAWERAIPAEAVLALFAVGGYGRGELFPQSDVDLLVLAEPDQQPVNADALARFFALLWDAGLPVGHAVRSLVQCHEAAAGDITILTSLLEARALAAHEGEREALADAIDPRRVWPAKTFFEAKREELRERHARFGDTADNLEPNLKEGPGGLRDVQTLHWMALRIVGTEDLESLVAIGQLGADEVATIERQRRALSKLRFGLHLVAGKREERLRFDYQKSLAERLGFVDKGGTLAVEQMMQGFYRSASLVLRIGERLLQRFEEQLEGEPTPKPLDDHFELRRGYLAASDPEWPHDDPELIFALFSTWASRDDVRGLHSQTARALAEALPDMPAFPKASPALRQQFLQLLRGPQPVATLTRLARLGVLGRWIPAFLKVSGRMQFDLFHVYTVDQHTLAVLKNLASFASSQLDERFALAHEVWPRLQKSELLLLAGLFHDIAKGRGGDHSKLGAADAREFCESHRMVEPDTALVEWLVRQHLLMSMTAQKQDIADPDVIHGFATEVGSRQRLDHLYLLTCADIAGTSPKLWNGWKDRLLADLYNATRIALRRGLEHPLEITERSAQARAATRALLSAEGVGEDEIDRLFALMPETGFERGRVDQLVWQAMALRGVSRGAVLVSARPVEAHPGALEVFVYSTDRDGLFAAIVAMLDRSGLAIQQARVLDGPHGTIFDTFEVIPADSRYTPTAEEVERKLGKALAGSLNRIRPARRTQPRHLRHFRIPPQIKFDDDGEGRTILTFVCTDRPGLLADVAQALRGQSLRVHDARIATFGERAEDVFQLTIVDSEGHDQTLDLTQQQTLSTRLLACFEGDDA